MHVCVLRACMWFVHASFAHRKLTTKTTVTKSTFAINLNYILRCWFVTFTSYFTAVHSHSSNFVHRIHTCTPESSNDGHSGLPLLPMVVVTEQELEHHAAHRIRMTDSMFHYSFSIENYSGRTPTMRIRKHWRRASETKKKSGHVVSMKNDGQVVRARPFESGFRRFQAYHALSPVPGHRIDMRAWRTIGNPKLSCRHTHTPRASLRVSFEDYECVELGRFDL